MQDENKSLEQIISSQKKDQQFGRPNGSRFKRRQNSDRDGDWRGNNNRFNNGNNQGNNSNKQSKEHCRLRISNLKYTVGEDQLLQIFSKFGNLKRCKIDWDNSGRSNETATIEYYDHEDAEKALKDSEGILIENQAISIEYAPFDDLNIVRRPGRINKSNFRNNNNNNSNNNRRNGGGNGRFEKRGRKNRY